MLGVGLYVATLGVFIGAVDEVVEDMENHEELQEKIGNDILETLVWEVEKGDSEYSSPNLVSTMENTSDKTIESISFDIKFLDADGVEVANGAVYAQDVAPGAKVKLEQMLYDDEMEKADSYTVSLGSCWIMKSQE